MHCKAHGPCTGCLAHTTMEVSDVRMRELSGLAGFTDQETLFSIDAAKAQTGRQGGVQYARGTKQDKLLREKSGGGANESGHVKRGQFWEGHTQFEE